MNSATISESMKVMISALFEPRPPSAPVRPSNSLYAAIRIPRKILAPLKALFATAVDELAVTFNPTLGVRVKGGGASGASQAHKAIPASDLRALLRALPEREQLLCMVLAETGMRISEALGLDWTDVELGRRDQIRISQQYYRGELRKLKTEKSLRCLPISKSLAKRLRRARAKTNGEGAVFVSRRGTRLSDRNVRRTFAKACTRAQIGLSSPFGGEVRA